MLRNFAKLARGLAVARQPIGHIRIAAPCTRYFSSDTGVIWPKEIQNFLNMENIIEPTKIQQETLKYAIDNKDLVGIARTGSGKTLAFVIPAVMKILENRKMSQHQDKKPSCLVLQPTRELANQTSQVFKKFKYIDIRAVTLVGGASRHNQIGELREHDPDVLIATPGRLTDLHDSGVIDLKNINYLVLDEADRMLDMGFEPQVRRIVKSIPKERQTLMWSATWPTEIRKLANEFMTDYKYVAVDSEDLKANPNIVQIVEVCRESEKQDLVLAKIQEIRKENEQAKFLIFCNTKRRVDYFTFHLMRNNTNAFAMHGDKSQNQRDGALASFKGGRCNVLIATDVAARGLDISDISHVINYDFPLNMEDYVHRIGRTARHDRKGTAISYLSQENWKVARKLMSIMISTNQTVPESLVQLAESSGMSDPDDMESPHQRRGFRDYGNQQRGGYPRRGFNNSRGRFNDTRGSFEDYRGGFNDSRGGFNDSRGGFNHSRGGFNDSRGGFNDSRGGFNDSRGGFNDSRGGRNRSSIDTDADYI